MAVIRNVQSSVIGFRLIPLSLRLKNDAVSQCVMPQSWVTSNNLAISRLSSSSGNQPKGWMGRYESFLSRRYPKFYTVQRMVIDGCKWCWSDIKTYYRLKKDLRTKTRQLTELKQPELEILLQVQHSLPFGNNPSNHTVSASANTNSGRESLRDVTKEEILKLAVIIIFIPLPFTVFIFALAVVLFPRLILTRHFWTNDQRKRFWSSSLKRTARLHFDPLRKHLQNLNVNIQTPLNELTKLKIPEMNTYSLGHLYHLSRIHRVSLFTAGIRGLHDRAEVLRHLDYLLKNGDSTIDAMNEQQLHEQFYLRSLQYDGLSEEQMKSLLKNWVQHLTDSRLEISTFLHIPIFETALKGATENLKSVQKC